MEGDRWPFAFRVSPLAAEIPTDIPDSLIAGDTWQWTRTFVDYPAGDGWQLSYFLRGAGTLDIVADADGDDFAITVPAGETEDLAAGTYQYLARVDGPDGTFTVSSGSVVVRSNLATAAAGTFQSVAEQMVVLIEAALLQNAATPANGGVGATVQSYTIGDRSVTFRDEVDLRKQLSHWKWKVWQEQHPGQLGPKRSVRFV